MHVPLRFLALAAALLAVHSVSSGRVPLAQDPPPAPTVAPGGAAVPSKGDPLPLLASDGEPVVAGRIPEKTSEEAQKLWHAFGAAQSPSSGQRTPIAGFRLGFDLRLREKEQSNDGKAYFAFIDTPTSPGWISCQMAASGRTLLHGPDGPFLIDGTETVSLRGREGKDDRRRIEEWISIARNFLALAQPERVRLVELRALPDTEPFVWPSEQLRALARDLDWLEVRSPDFHLYSSSQENASRVPVFRARLGLRREDPNTEPKEAGQLRLAILHEEREGRIDPASLQVIEVRKQTELGGYRLPSELAVWRASESPPFGTMAPRPYVELWLQKDGQIDPVFGPDDFRPPRR